MMRHRCPQCHDEKRVFEPVILGRFLVHRCTSCRFFIDAAEMISESHAAMLAEMETQRPANDVDERRPARGRYRRFELEREASANDGADIHVVRTRSDAPTTSNVDATDSEGPRRSAVARIAQPWLVAIALLGVCAFASISRTMGSALDHLATAKAAPPAPESDLGSVPFIGTAVVVTEHDVEEPASKNVETEQKQPEADALSPEGIRAARAGAYQRARARR